MSNLEICKICERGFKSLRSLAQHISGTHKITTEEYYVNHLGNGIHYCKCGNITKFRNLNIGFSKHCSPKCSYHDEDVLNKKKNTTLNKYGTEYAIGSDKVRKKIKNTLLNKYGSENLHQIDSVIKKIIKSNKNRTKKQKRESLDKRKITCIKKYGTDHPMKSEEVQEQSKNTCRNNLGVDYPSQNKEVVKKQQNTCLKKYGVTSPAKNKKILEKRNNTNIRRYGTPHVMQNKKIREKSLETSFNKYGFKYNGQHENAKNKMRQTNMYKYGKEYVFQTDDFKTKTKNTNIIKYGVEYVGQSREVKDKSKNTINNKTKKQHSNEFIKHDCILLDYKDRHYTFKCNVCNETMTEEYQFINVCRLKLKRTPCTNCISKNEPTSFKEKELLEFISELYSDEVVGNARDIISPKEIDIYIPKIKIGFEFNGVHYHNEKFKPNDYHLTKTEECNNKQIKLIHVFEDDWMYKQDIVKSRIKSLIGLHDRIYARKCKIQEVSNRESNIFLNNNHLQGHATSKYQYGLYHNETLVSLMTFGKSRFESNKIELIRFCNKLDTSVVGGASKLFKYFLSKNPNINEIISYADRCWSEGNLYNKLGFTFKGTTKPNYYYVVGDMRENRMKYQKHKLVKQGFDADKTEHEIMIEREIYRIYDCGNLKYEYIR